MSLFHSICAEQTAVPAMVARIGRIGSAGVDEARVARHLALIAEVSTVAARAGTPVWLRGGRAMDFFPGQVTRDHGDVDWFAWDGDARVLSDELLTRGYRECPGPLSDQQLDFVKDGEDVSFALLAKDASGRLVVAGGPWTESRGRPRCSRAGPDGSTRSRVRSSVPSRKSRFKQMMPIWVPERPRRRKDVRDIARLRAALRCGPWQRM